MKEKKQQLNIPHGRERMESRHSYTERVPKNILYEREERADQISMGWIHTEEYCIQENIYV